MIGLAARKASRLPRLAIYCVPWLDFHTLRGPRRSLLSAWLLRGSDSEDPTAEAFRYDPVRTLFEPTQNARRPKRLVAWPCRSDRRSAPTDVLSVARNSLSLSDSQAPLDLFC